MAQAQPDRQAASERARLERALTLATTRAAAAYDPHARWVDRVRAGLQALLEYADEEHELALLWVTQALVGRGTYPPVERAMTRLAVIIGEGHAASRATRQPPSLAAQSALSGALGLVHARLVSRDGRSLVELRNPLMATIVLPYLGQRAARRESRREPEHATARRNGSAAREDRAVGFRLTYRTMRVLAVIGDQPALSNRVVAEHAGISDAGQVSKLLARLTRLGLIENTGAGHTRGATNAWRLTREGEEFQRKIGRVSVYATTS